MKLAQIANRAAAPLSAASPQLAVAQDANQRQVVRAATDLFSEIGNQKRDYDQRKATADYAQQVSAFQKFAAENPTASKQDLQDAGYVMFGDRTAFDHIDTSQYEDGAIPKHAWYPQALERVMANAQATGAEKILDPNLKRAWREETGRIASDQVVNAYAQSAKDAVNYEVKIADADVRAAIQSGQIERALSLLQADVWNNNPAMRTTLTNMAMRQGEMDELSGELGMATTEDELDDFLDKLGPEYEEKSFLTNKEVQAYRNSALTKSQQLATQYDKAEAEQQDALASDTMAFILENEMTFERLERLRPKLGWQNYKYLQSQLLAQNKRIVETKSSPDALGKYYREMNQLESGEIGGAEYYDKINGMLTKLSGDIMTLSDQGDVVGQLSAADANTIRTRLRELRDLPGKRPEVVQLRKRAHIKILGRSESAEYESRPITEAESMAYAGAMQDLDNYLREWGANADLDRWEKVHLPLYIEDPEQRRRATFPARLSSYVKTSGYEGDIKTMDVEATEAALREQEKAMLQLPEDDYSRQLFERDILLFEEWKIKYGQ